jgi:hypothetical protein
VGVGGREVREDGVVDWKTKGDQGSKDGEEDMGKRKSGEWREGKKKRSGGELEQ